MIMTNRAEIIALFSFQSMMVVTLLSGLRNISVSIVVGVSGSLVLKDFLVVVGQVILPSSRFALGHLRSVFSKPLVDEGLLLNSIDVHIVDRGKLRFLFKSLGLSAPVGLYAFHVPLVDDSYDIFVILKLIKFAEYSNVPLVN
jgi:hypothetical protein